MVTLNIVLFIPSNRNFDTFGWLVNPTPYSLYLLLYSTVTLENCLVFYLVNVYEHAIFLASSFVDVTLSVPLIFKYFNSLKRNYNYVFDFIEKLLVIVKIDKMWSKYTFKNFYKHVCNRLAVFYLFYLEACVQFELIVVRLILIIKPIGYFNFKYLKR